MPTTFEVGVTLESGDSVVDAGDGEDAVQNVTLAFGADRHFDGSLENASVANTTVHVAGEQVEVSNVTVDEPNATVTVGLATPASVSPDDRLYVRVRNVTTPSLPEYELSEDREQRWKNRMRFHVDVSVSDPDGNVDGPARVEYSVIKVDAWPRTPVVAGFESTQTLHVRGLLPNHGYIVAHEMTASGPGEIVGVSEYTRANNFRQNIDVRLDRSVHDGARLQLSLYREASGDDSFDPDADELYRNAGVNATRTISVVVPEADAHMRGGTVWAGQTLLHEGRPNTPYVLHRVTDDGGIGAPVEKTTATDDGVVLVNTSELTVGDRYVLVNRLESAVVDLDRNGDRRVSNDAMTVERQSVSASMDEETLVLDSERGDYVVWVSAEAMDDDDVRAAFGDAAVSTTEDHDGVPVRVPVDSRLAVDTTALDPGEYNLTVSVPDTGLESMTTLSIDERETATPVPTTDEADSTTTTIDSSDDADDGTETTAPLGPLVPLIALACAALLLARTRT